MTTNLVKFLPCLPEPFVQIPAAFLHQFLNHQTALLQVRSVQPLLLFQIGAVGPLVLLHFPFLHAHFLLLQHTITHNGHSASYILVSQYYVLVSPMASFPQASPPTPCAPLYPPPYAPHALPISFLSILPPAQYWVILFYRCMKSCLNFLMSNPRILTLVREVISFTLWLI